MRGDADASRTSSPSPARTAIVSSPNNKIVQSNGSSNGKTSSNGHTTSHRNGSSPSTLRITQPTFYGHDREEVTRILIQGLSDLGYESAAGALSRESGYDLETPYASAFRIAILQGDWQEAEALLSVPYHDNGNGGISDSTDLVSRQGGLPTSSGGDKTRSGLQLSPEADKGEMLFLIRRQKYLELLEIRDLGAALMVLRQELQPLNQDERQLHALSSFIMCQSSDDLKSQADWDGADGESRKLLMSDLSRFISPSVLIPGHRLAKLLTQVKESQIQQCEYHNQPRWPSLYMNHTCDRSDFPLDTVCELDRHRDEVWHLAFSNDGTKLATASKDSCVVIYETTSFRCLKRLQDHAAPVAYVTWSPDDRRLVSCSQDHTAKLWDVETGTCLRTLKHREEPVTSAAWAPDGRTFVTGTLDVKDSLSIWSADVGPDATPLYSFDSCSRVQDCAIATVSPPPSSIFAADSHAETRPVRLIVACIDKTIHVYDYTHRLKLSEIQLERKIGCLNLSRDGREMLLNLKGGEIWTMGVEDGEIKQRFRGQQQENFVIRSCFGGAMEGCVVSGSEENSKINIWHRHTGRLLEQLEGHRSGSVNAIAWNTANPSMFASAGDDHKVRIWSSVLPRERVQQIQQSHSQNLNSATNSFGSEGSGQGDEGRRRLPWGSL